MVRYWRRMKATAPSKIVPAISCIASVPMSRAQDVPGEVERERDRGETGDRDHPGDGMDLHETSELGWAIRSLLSGRARLAYRVISHTETPAEGRVSASASGCAGMVARRLATGQLSRQPAGQPAVDGEPLRVGRSPGSNSQIAAGLRLADHHRAGLRREGCRARLPPPGSGDPLAGVSSADATHRLPALDSDPARRM